VARERQQVEPKKPPLWLISYGDMMTNLMTFFVLLVTFAGSSKENFERFRSSFFSRGLFGLGVAGPLKSFWDNYSDAMVDRFMSLSARRPEPGSSVPARYREQLLESVGQVRSLLDTGVRDEEAGTLALRLPTDQLVAGQNQLAGSGEVLIRSLATVFDFLPHRIQFLAGSEGDLPAAVTLTLALAGQWPGAERVAVGLKPGAPDPGSVWLLVLPLFD
jgi:chemotaxis protein MotB